MTVTSDVIRKSFNGDGVSVHFDTPFAFRDAADVNVVLVLADESTQPQTLTTHYTVAGGLGQSGTVQMLAPPPAGSRLVMFRSTPRTQETDYPEGGNFPAQSHEQALDKLTYQNQEQADALNRALKLPETTASDVQPTLPEPQADRALVWNAAADGLENSAFSLDQYRTDSQNAATSAAEDAATAQAAASTAQAAASTATSAADTAAADAVTAVNGQLLGLATDAQTAEANAANSEQAAAASAAQVMQALGAQNFFEEDAGGNLMPTESPSFSTVFQLDNGGDIQPI